MDFNLGHWLEIFRSNPILMVLLGGLVAGTVVTQAIKFTYLKLFPKDVTDARYSIGVWWLAILSSGAFTQWFWMAIMPADIHGHLLSYLTSITAGFLSPCLYWLGKRLLGWWKPDLAKRLGDGPGTEDT